MNTIDWHQLNMVASALIAALTLAGLVFGWFKWEAIKCFFSTTWGVFVAIGQLPQLHVTVQGMNEGIDDLRTTGNDRGAAIRELADGQTAIVKSVALLGMTLDATINADPNIATARAAPNGSLIEASSTYTRWTGLSFERLSGMGWINCVHGEDRTRVREEWRSAVEECRESRMRYRMLSADGLTFFEVNVVATPIPQGSNPCDKFIVIISRED